MIEREYDPALLAFVIQTQKNLATVKEQLIAVAQRIESDEKVYIYHSKYDHIPRWPGEAVGAIANYKQERVQLLQALNKIVQMWSFEDADAARYLFFVGDGLDEIDIQRLRNIAQKDKNTSWETQPIKFFFILDQVPQEVIEGVTFIQLDDPAQLEKVITKHYKGVETPFLIKGYEPLNIDELRVEYGKTAQSEDGEDA